MTDEEKKWAECATDESYLRDWDVESRHMETLLLGQRSSLLDDPLLVDILEEHRVLYEKAVRSGEKIRMNIYATIRAGQEAVKEARERRKAFEASREYREAVRFEADQVRERDEAAAEQARADREYLREMEENSARKAVREKAAREKAENERIETERQKAEAEREKVKVQIRLRVPVE